MTVVGCAVPLMILFKGILMKGAFLSWIAPRISSPNEPQRIHEYQDVQGMAGLRHFAKYKVQGRVLLIFDGAKCHLSPSIVAESSVCLVKQPTNCNLRINHVLHLLRLTGLTKS